MARKLRVEYAGAVYHVMNRGDRREVIFKDDVDRERLLGTLAEACGKTGWQVHALCLLPNHFHLVVETPQANLVAGMKWLLGTYTGRFNRRHQLSGHLFERTLQGADRGRQRQRLLEDRVRLRASEPGAGETAPAGRAVAGVCLEQLAGILDTSRPAVVMAVFQAGLSGGRVPMPLTERQHPLR